MDSIYLQASSRLQGIYPGLASLERCTNDDEAALIERQLHAEMDEIFSSCERLDILVNKEPMQQRRNAKYKVDQLKYDLQHLRAALAALLQKRQQRRRFEDDRNQLLTRKFTSNDDSTAIYLEDAALQHNDRLTNAHSQIDDLLSSGSMILDNLRHQGLSMKNMKRKILDVANTLGLSNTVMRFIERRTAQDRWILFGGMIVTLFIMYVLYRWIKG